MWKKSTIKEPKSSADLKVSIAINQTCRSEWIASAEDWQAEFKKELEVIRSPGGGYSVANFYKSTPRNQHSVEIWKLDSKGGFKELRWIVTYHK